MRAVIITGGDIGDYSFYKGFFENDDVIICADGGSKHLRKLELRADYFLGDFDSCNFEEAVNSECLQNAHIMRFKKEKDETDTEIAINLAIEKGFKNIVIIGALGTRFDHTLANVLLLKKALKNDIDAKIVNEKNEIWLIDKSISLDPVENAYISLIALDEVSNLSLKNLKYPLNNFTLKSDMSIGISNEFTNDKAIITFDCGTLLVIISND